MFVPWRHIWYVQYTKYIFSTRVPWGIIESLMSCSFCYHLISFESPNLRVLGVSCNFKHLKKCPRIFWQCPKRLRKSVPCIVARLVWDLSWEFCTLSLRLTIGVACLLSCYRWLPPQITSLGSPAQILGSAPCEIFQGWFRIHNQTFQVNPPMLNLARFTHTHKDLSQFAWCYKIPIK